MFSIVVEGIRAFVSKPSFIQFFETRGREQLSFQDRRENGR